MPVKYRRAAVRWIAMRIASLLIVVAAAGAARAEPPSSAQLAQLAQLAAIGARRTAKPPALQAVCTPPAKAELAAVKQRVLAWIDQQAPGEKASGPAYLDGMDLVFNACNVAGGTVVDVSQDRVTRKDGSLSGRSNFVLRVAGDSIEVIAQRSSTASNNWMEWADEGRLRFVAELDVDGDGAADLVWSDFEHEGGASSTYDNLHVRLATGEQRPIARVKNPADNRVVAGQLVVAGRVHTEDRAVYACIDKDLHAARCAAAAPFQRTSDRIDIAAGLTTLSEVPDRDQVVEWLAVLGVKPPAGLLAALPATTPQQTAERHVAAFLAGKQLDEPFQDVFDQPHPEAAAYFDQLATQLGDTRCTAAPLGDLARAQLTDWVAKQDKAPEAIALTPECGKYAWVTWNHYGDLERHEVLMALDGPAPAKVARFRQPPYIAQVGIVDPYENMFFQHGDTVVGVVIRDQNMSVIANGKVVAQSHGQIARYAFDRRWHETSPDLVVDGGTLFHPSPTGLDKPDRSLVQDREAQRRALERVLHDPPSKDPAYLAALRTLGARAELVAECKKL
jgi:hypothetical protein